MDKPDRMGEVESQAAYLIEQGKDLITGIENIPSMHYEDGVEVKVAGHLGSSKSHCQFYRETLKAGPMIMQWIEHGYSPPFISTPPINRTTLNNKSALLNQEFMEQVNLE